MDARKAAHVRISVQLDFFILLSVGGRCGGVRCSVAVIDVLLLLLGFVSVVHKGLMILFCCGDFLCNNSLLVLKRFDSVAEGSIQ